MKRNKVSPLEFMISNRKIILDAVQTNQSFQIAWDFLANELPQINEITKFNTFKSYIKILLIVDEKLKENEQLKEELQKYETEKKQLIQEKESLSMNLQKLVSEIKSLRESEIKKVMEKDKNATDKKIPQQVEGWGVQLKDPYYRLFKKINGKVKWIHVGRKWDHKLAWDKIQKFDSCAG
jgi:seryl-tRNA synthetase